MEGLVNTISSATSTLINFIPRPVLAFGGRIVDAVSLIKNNTFGASSPDATPLTSLQQRRPSTVSPEVGTEILIDPGSPANYPEDTNIGVVGSPRTCKSSLINALRNLEDEDHGAAATGDSALRQTATERYQLDGSTFLCELPGSDTNEPDRLAERSGLDYYDALVIVQNDLNVAAEILQLTSRAIDKGIPVYVARPMMDATIISNYHKGAAKATMDQPVSELCEDIRDELVRNFRSTISAENFYLCSNFDRTLYELDGLKRKLLQVEKRPVSEQ